MMAKLLVTLAFMGIALTEATHVYKDSDESLEYDVKNCERLKGVPRGTEQQIECMNNEAILAPWQDYIDGSISSNIARTDEVLCRGQRGICKAKTEYWTDLDPGCKKMVDGCRSALRHIHDMMFKADPTKQECNNFALKSVRGFFHDYMTTNVEGSVLSENHLDMNVGLCRWTQYVNVLSDHTMCDAGSIIQMAGFLGYEACGFPLWEVDFDVKPYVNLNWGMACHARSTGEDAAPKKKSHPLFNAESGQRLAKFSDIAASAVSKTHEDFWCSVNPHACAKGDNRREDDLSDGEVEYALEATAAAHVIGRVTCDVHGTDINGETPVIKPGFFHRPRSDEAKGVGTANLKKRVDEGYAHLQATQCGKQSDYPGVPSSDGKVPTGGVRLNTTRWQAVDGETNLNTVGGACGMPTQFKKTVNMGGRHRVARFMAIASDDGYSEQTEAQKAQCTDRSRSLYLPLELLTLTTDVPLPTSPALTRFMDIAWDGVGTIDSAWDGCVVGCDIDVSANRMCGGEEGLSDFKWFQESVGTPREGTPSEATGDEAIEGDEDGINSAASPSVGACIIVLIMLHPFL